MKVAFYPNICNNNYPIIKSLRQFGNIDAHLYISANADIQNLPESEDPTLKDNYPSWIHKSKDWTHKGFLKQRSKAFINELNKYDIVFLSEFALMLAPYIRAKKIFIVTGGDLTKVPFANKFALETDTIIDVLKRKYVAYLQKKGILSMDEAWSQPFAPFVNAFKELNYPEQKIKPTIFKVFIDKQSIYYKSDCLDNLDATVRNQISQFDFKIFHPSRIMMKQTKGLIESGQWKQNDLLFYAFKNFLEANNNPNACIILIDRIHGGEIVEAKKIIKEIGIEKNVVWLKAKSVEGFTKNELVNLYSAADVVVDEFGIGWFGSIVCEGLACSKPVMCFIDEVAMAKMYPWHPIISNNTIDGVAAEITKLYLDKDYANAVGKKGLEWINEFHTFDTAGKTIAEEIKQMLL